MVGVRVLRAARRKCVVEGESFGGGGCSGSEAFDERLGAARRAAGGEMDEIGDGIFPGTEEGRDARRDGLGGIVGEKKTMADCWM